MNMHLKFVHMCVWKIATMIRCTHKHIHSVFYIYFFNTTLKDRKIICHYFNRIRLLYLFRPWDYIYICVCIYIHSGKLPWLWKKDYEKIVWWTLHRERLTEVRSLARKKWGIDDLLPRNNGNDMELWCFMEIYIWSDLIGFMNRQVGFLGLIGNKTNGSPTMKNWLNWWWFPHFGEIQHLLQWKMGCLDLQLMAMKWWQTWGFKPLDFGEGVAPFSSSIRWISAPSHQKIGHAFIKARWPISPIMEGQCVCKCSQNENTNHIDPYRGTS